MKVTFCENSNQPGKVQARELYELIAGIQSGTWQGLVQQARQLEGEAYKKFKKSGLPGFTVSALFENYKDLDHYGAHSGFVAVDIDKQDNPAVDLAAVRAKIEAEATTYACFSSIGGQGFAAIFKVNSGPFPVKTEPLKKWKEELAAVQLSYLTSLQHHFESKYGVKIDTVCKDVSRIRFVSYDTKTYVNEDAQEWKGRVLPQIAAKPKPLPKVPTLNHQEYGEIVLERARKMIQDAKEGEKHAAVRDAAMLCGGYLHTTELTSGRAYDVLLSAVQNKEGVASIDNAINLIETGLTKGADRLLFPPALKRRIQGFSKTMNAGMITTALAAETDLPEDKLQEAIQEIIDSNSGSDIFSYLEEFVVANYKLKRNEITKRIEDNGEPLTEEGINSLYIAAYKQVSDKVTQAQIMALLGSNFIESYNPIQDFFAGNQEHPTASGSIQRLAATVVTDTGDEGFFEYYFRKWLVGLVACAYYQPSPLLLVLTGAQNSGKSEFFKRLLPEPLQPYLAKSTLDKGKDDELLMTQKLLIYDDEFGGKSKRDNARLKDLTSTQVFSLRAPYAKANADYKRLACLGGTSNEADLLTDPTGNRRLIPINVLGRDWEAFDAIDKTGLLIEAYQLFRDGFEYHLSKEDIQRLNRHTSQFEAAVSERELLLLHYQIPPPGVRGVLRSTSEIKSFLQNVSGNNSLNLRTLGVQLQELGFARKTVRVGNAYPKLYEVIEGGVVISEAAGKIPEQDSDLPF